MLELLRARMRMEESPVMSDTRKVTLDFNTAITGLDPETGIWDEKAHSKTVMPLRGLIMRTDGVSGCFISRYDMEITYVPGVTNRELVIEAAQAAVREISENLNFFPLRGEKIPTATAPELKKSVHETWWVARVTFETDLFINTDEVSTKKIIDELIARLAEADGARQPGATQRMLYVRFDPRQVSSENMTAHLEKVIAEVMEKRTEKGYFPFAEPVFTYEAYTTPYII